MQRILVVDDNRELAENLAEILEDEGFAVDVFDDPCKVIDQVRPGAYAAAVLDIRMPRMDGIDLYRKLKERDSALPALAMTAWAADDRIREAVRVGIIAVLSKPLDVPLFLRRLASLVGGDPALVVEDDEALAQNLVEILGERGFSVRVAHDCEEARRIADQMRFDVILADYRLPDGDGLELVEKLSTRDGSTAVVFSGYLAHLPPGRNDAGDRIHFFEKPIDLTRLLDTIGPPRTP